MDKKTVLVYLLILSLAFVFYWFQLRPTKIKERCSSEAHFDQRATLEFDEVKRQEFINRYYEDCLMRFGIK